MFFNTLHKAIEKELKNSIYKNEYFLEQKWNFAERFITWCAVRPILSQVLFLLTFSMICLINYKILDMQFAYCSSWDSATDFKDLIFNGQLTILALIFPLVIGSVGFIIRNDVANQALWKIYGTYSGFMFIGLSGLTLAITMITIYSFSAPWIDKHVAVALILTFSIWFIFNLILVGWLLYSTFKFIHTKKQQEILNKYNINNVLINEIRKRLFTRIPLQADKLGLIKKRDGRVRSRIEFFYSDYIHSHTDKISESFTKAKYLKNINYTLLSFAIKLWNYKNTVYSRRNLKLYLPVTGSGYPSKVYDLALVSKYDLSWPQDLLIRWSYTFSKENKFAEEDIMTIVNAMFNNIENALQNKNTRAFSSSVDTLQTFMRNVIYITNFKENVKTDNWLLLSDNSFFSRRLLDELFQQYYKLNSLVIDKTLESDSYFREFYSIYPHFIDSNYVHIDIQKAILQVHYYLWVYMIKNKKLKETAYYNDLFIKYIGGWESWSYARMREVDNWEKAKDNANFLNEHLMLSCKHIIVSIKHNNDIATVWAINILNNWNENYQLERSYDRYIMNTNILGNYIFSHEENSDLIKFITGKNEEKNQIKSLHDNALVNNFIHSRILTAAYILNNNVDNFSDIAIEAIYALINGQRISPERHARKTFNFNISENILEAYILNLSCVWRITQNALGYSLIKDFYSIDEPERISGRVYGGLVSDDINSLKQSFITLLICHSSSGFRISENMYKFICSELFPTNNRIDLKIYLEELTNISNDSKEKVKKILVTENIDDLLEKYDESLRHIIDRIDTYTQESISNQPISENRKTQIKKYCSKEAFKKETAGFPMSLFNNIEYLSVLHEEHKREIHLHNVDRKSLIDDDINRSINEDDFYAGLVKEQVNIFIFREIFNKIDYINKKFDDEVELLVAMLKDSNMPENMIMLIGENDISSFIYSLSWDRDKKVPFKISKNDGYGDNYIGHINNIPAYKIWNFDMDFCLLVNEDLFQNIKIKKYDDDIFVDLKYEEDEENINQGILNISYIMEVVLNKDLVNYKYTFIKKSEE